jgi:hypothetical protein
MQSSDDDSSQVEFSWKWFLEREQALNRRPHSFPVLTESTEIVVTETITDGTL